MIPPLPLQPISASDQQAAYAQLRRLSGDEATAFYETEVFPLAAQTLLARRSEQPVADLLILPVGTQPYSPSLAALAIPARAVALLHTVSIRHEDGQFDPGSEMEALRVNATLQQLPEATRPVTERFRLGDGIDALDIANAVQAALAWAGDPWPTRITLDLSGGRKATASALGAIATLSGWRQTYLESQPIVSRFHGHERLHHLGDFGQLFHDDDRIAANALLAAGHFDDALDHLERAAASLLAGPGAAGLLAFAQHFTADKPAPSLLNTLLAPWQDTALPDLLARASSNRDRGVALLTCFREEGLWR